VSAPSPELVASVIARNRATLQGRVERIREATGFSLDDVAATVGVSRTTLWSWLSEKGGKEPSEVFESRLQLMDRFIRHHWNEESFSALRTRVEQEGDARKLFRDTLTAIIGVEDITGKPAQLPSETQFVKLLRETMSVFAQEQSATRRHRMMLRRYGALKRAQEQYRANVKAGRRTVVQVQVPSDLLDTWKAGARDAQRPLGKHMDLLLAASLRDAGLL
jgi:transcriptional regulator with XRE-family HTH domain